MSEQIATDQFLLRVTDLKQWAYCPRILYYFYCLPDIRPLTYKMKAGIEAGQAEEDREERRSLRPYGLTSGWREYNRVVRSERYKLQGVVDMVIWSEGEMPLEAIPVDYKLSAVSGKHFQLQLAAYGLLLEESSGRPARRGFLYHIPTRKAEEVRLDGRLRKNLLLALESIRRAVFGETMPEPAAQRGKCVSCEFRRFCNDVL